MSDRAEDTRATADVMQRAHVASRLISEGWSATSVIASEIMAERERCAKLVEQRCMLVWRGYTIEAVGALFEALPLAIREDE